MSTDRTAVLQNLIEELTRRGARAVWLYGSVARGEQMPGSDIDVLAVVDTPTEPFVMDEVQVAPYTPTRLIDMATRGSLFIRHIIDEARPLVDDEAILLQLRQAFVEVPPEDHLNELRIASGLLDVSDEFYEEFWTGLHACAAFVLRSLAYLRARQEGLLSFSMTRVLSFINDDQLQGIAALRDCRSSDLDLYRRALKTIESYQAQPPVNPFKSVDALTVNSWPAHDLVFTWGLRILTKNTAKFPYG